jgi:phenol hydroxylase P4 protein
MTTLAKGPYKFEPRDAQSRFGDKQLLYVFWEKHLIFSRPMTLLLKADTLFSEVIEKHVTQAYSFHPDFAKIDWSRIHWIKSGKPFYPDVSKSLEENGLRHKDLIRMVTPDLDGLNGLGS